MIEYTEQIRERAKDLLEKGTVDVFIGYKKGSVPMMNEPVLIGGDLAGLYFGIVAKRGVAPLERLARLRLESLQAAWRNVDRALVLRSLGD